MNKITVYINGSNEQIEIGLNLGQVIDVLQIPSSGAVFSINNKVVPRSNWNKTQLSDGDSISLFQVIAGG